jgi:hypothetical protein
MNVPLQKWYKRIIPLLLIFCLLCNQLAASPDCPIISGNFSGLSEGTTVNNSSTGWYLNATNVASGAIFWVKSNRFHAQELGGEGVWYSKVFSVAGYTNFQIATKITAEGDMNSSEYVKVYYKINGGAEILLDQRTGNFGTFDFISPLLNGSNVQFVIRIYNYNNGGSQTSKYYVEDYRVFKEHGPCAGGIPVSVSAGNNGVLTCANSSLTLSASSSASGVSYSWTGPGSFTSNAQSPVINVAGTYNVVATNSSGSGSASITVTENKTAPGVTATGASLGCASSVTISATSQVANAQYSWSGPGFSSTLQNPVVSTAGTYTVTVTNPANGCTSSQQVQVTTGNIAAGTFWLEDFAFTNGTTTDTGTTPWTLENSAAGTFSVQNNELMVAFNATNEGVWKSGVINIAAKSNVVFSLNLKSGTASGNDFFEDEDYIRVYYKLNGGAETLLFSDISGLKGTNTGTAYDTVISPALNGSSLQIIVRLKNSNSTERYYLDNVKLTGYNTGTAPLSASVTGVATCTGTVQLNATAISAVSTWSWTGPNGFTSALQNPAVSTGGQYIVTANFTDGCSASVPVTVTENKTAPGVTASGGSLACFTSITINASSPLATAQYSWSGPSSFTSTLKNPSVTAAGTYTVTVTDPANGCTSTQSVQVTPAYGVVGNLWQETFPTNGINVDNDATSWSITAPSGAVAATNGNQFRISNVGTTSEVVWTSGSINIAGKSNVTISAGVRSSVTGGAVMNETGEYADYVRFYYQLNNGSEVLFHEKRGIINSHSTTLSAVSVGSLSGSSLRIIVRARATGNDEFYHFDNVTVAGADQNTLTAVASADGTISCSSNTVTLEGSSNTAGVSYSWSGPGSFSSTLQNPSVSVAGIYTLTVTDPSTNCTATDTALVSTSLVASNLWQEQFPTNGISVDTDATPWSTTAPSGAVAATNGNQFRVSNTGTAGEVVWTSGSINIAGKSNVTIAAGIRSSVTGSGVMNETGTYADYIRFYYKLNTGAEVLFYEKLSDVNSHNTTLTALTSGALNGDSLRIIVRARATGNDEFYYFDNVLVTGVAQSGLDASASVSDTLDCMTSSVTLSGSSTAAGVTYSWTGPNGFTAATQNATTSTPGTYTLTVSNGSCSATATVTVIQGGTAPANVQVGPADADSVLTCNRNHVFVAASSSTPGVLYSWSGPDWSGVSGSLITVFNPGVYTVVVTNPANGCTVTKTYTVRENRVFPGASATPNLALLTCTNPSILITAGATNSTTVSYTWTRPDSTTATGGTITAATPGNYGLLVTDTVNGCTTWTGASIIEYRIVPSGLSITAPANAGALTCTNPQVTLTGNATSGNVDYSWSGPGGFNATTSVINASVEGEYTMTATHTVSGCSAFVNYNVVQNMEAPAAVVITPIPANAMVTCTAPNVNLNASSTTPSVTYSWSGPSFSSAIPNPAVDGGGTYTVTVTNPANGCTTIDSIAVTENTTPPAGITAFSSDQLTCFTQTVNISGNSGTMGVEYSWTGPSGFTANTKIAPVTVPGPYNLKVTNPVNGCFGTAVANVVQNITPPDITVSNTGPLTCEVFDVEIQGSSTTPDVDYSWTGPEGFSSNLPVDMVFFPGDYILTILDLNNGCTSTDTTTVEQDLTGCEAVRPGNAKTGTVQSETAAAQTGKAEKTAQLEYRAYPNPFNDRINVEFKTPENAVVNVGIYNTVGACKKVLFNNSVQAGQLYKLPFDATMLPPGVYYCVIRINGKPYTIKMIAIKK